ncbi:hypothetical protein Hdeb2414_s0028g00701821 [Helianthus debilis subsp. tardiflorus]
MGGLCLNQFVPSMVTEKKCLNLLEQYLVCTHCGICISVLSRCLRDEGLRDKGLCYEGLGMSFTTRWVGFTMFRPKLFS